MAGNLPVPQGLETKVVWTLAGQPFALNIVHFRNAQSAALTQTLANQIDTFCKTAFTNSNLAPLFPTTVALLHVQSRSMIANSDPWFIGTGAAVPGTSAGKPLPAATALCITSKTGLRGRSYNGRIYLAGWAENANDTVGGATAAAAAAAVNWITNWAAAMNGGTPQFQQCVLSRFTTPAGSPPNTPPTERNPPLLTTVTSNVALDQRWDTQRRRAHPGV